MKITEMRELAEKEAGLTSTLWQVCAEICERLEARPIRKRTIRELHPEALVFAKRFRLSVLKISPRARVPSEDGLLPWAKEFNRIFDNDGREPEQVAKVCSWVFGDNRKRSTAFVVLSPKSLREKYDRIVEAMKRLQGSSARPVPRPYQPPVQLTPEERERAAAARREAERVVRRVAGATVAPQRQVIEDIELPWDQK